MLADATLARVWSALRRVLGSRYEICMTARLEGIDGEHVVISVLVGEGPELGRAATLHEAYQIGRSCSTAPYGPWFRIYQDGQIVAEEQQVACTLPPPQGDSAERCCSFCGMRQAGNRRLIGGEIAGVYICAECVSVCSAVLDDERGDDPAG